MHMRLNQTKAWKNQADRLYSRCRIFQCPGEVCQTKASHLNSISKHVSKQLVTVRMTSLTYDQFWGIERNVISISVDESVNLENIATVLTQNSVSGFTRFIRGQNYLF